MKRRLNSVGPSAMPTLLIDSSEASGQLQERVDKGKKIINIRPKNTITLEEAQSQFHRWDKYNEVYLGRIFLEDKMRCEYALLMTIKGAFSFPEKRKIFVDSINTQVRKLEEIIEMLPLYSSASSAASTRTIDTLTEQKNRDVFIVHGHHNELKQTVARYLTNLKLNPIILHEQPSAGRTIIQKFEDHSNACFAVILLTPDDIGGLASTESMNELSKRARQNVIFEWGFFVAKLGRGNVCGLLLDGLEPPSDMNGILCVPVDSGGGWKVVLAQEIKAGGIEIDMNLLTP